MHRFFLAKPNISGTSLQLSDKEQLHHLKDVLRIEPEDKVILFDGRGNEYLVLLKGFSEKVAVFDILEKKKVAPDKGPRLTVACAIPKKAKMDDIVDKLTQVGVERIIPLETERVIIRLDKEKESLRHKRWQKISLNASQQSQRKLLPQVDPIRRLREVLSSSGDFDLKLIPTLEGTKERKSLKEALSGSGAKNIIVLIGPEGDFSPQEVKLAISAGFIPVTLGEETLRVDTAAIAVASYIMFSFSGNR